MAAADENDRKLESLLGGSEEVYSLICLPCHRDDSYMPAIGYCKDCQEHLCVNCYKYHKKATPSRHHKLLDKEKMPCTQRLTDAHTHTDAADNLTTPCAHHKTEILKFYCMDHNELLCSICVAQEHTKNCIVEYIPHGEILNEQYYIAVMSRIEQLLKKCTGLKTETARDVIKSNDSLKNALLDIKKYRQEINDRIDELEKEIRTKVQALQDKNNERLKTVDTTCEDVIKMLQGMNDNLLQLDASEQADKLFVEVLQFRKQINDYEDMIFSLSAEDRIGEYTFNPSQAITDVLQRETMIGDVSMEKQGGAGTASQPAPLASSADGNITPTLLGEIFVKTTEDRGSCFIMGMTALPPNRLVLTDSNNNSIKLVDVNKRSITSQLSLGKEVDDKPFDITSITNKQVAVTVPGRQRIQLLSVSLLAHKLKKTNEIQTDGHCFGICCSQKQLIVTYQYGNKLDIMDMKGRVITRVQLPSAGKDINHQPDCVQANNRGIYVSDNYHVIILNWAGEITGTFEDVVYPSCVNLLHDGSVIVCDFITGSLCQLSADGTNRGTVLQDLRSPAGTCVNTGRHELYISRFTDGKKEIDNNILVYKI